MARLPLLPLTNTMSPLLALTLPMISPKWVPVVSPFRLASINSSTLILLAVISPAMLISPPIPTPPVTTTAPV